MTTDLKRKEYAVNFELEGKCCSLGGIAKGSGMIHPNMATMLVFLTTDVNISSELLEKAIREDADQSFHMVSVDGDTSTNDMVSIMANGLAGNMLIQEETQAYQIFKRALNQVTEYLCKAIAADGEGATKLLTCRVEGASDLANARLAAKGVICSSLLKSAMFGADANWGRVLCAIGYSGAAMDTEGLDVSFLSKAGSIVVCRQGCGLEFDEDKARTILQEPEVTILIQGHEGDSTAEAWGCDLTYDYVKINGDYRT